MFSNQQNNQYIQQTLLQMQIFNILNQIYAM